MDVCRVQSTFFTMATHLGLWCNVIHIPVPPYQSNVSHHPSCDSNCFGHIAMISKVKNDIVHWLVPMADIDSSLLLFCTASLVVHRRRNQEGQGGQGGQGSPIFYPRDCINIHTCSADYCIAVYITFPAPFPGYSSALNHNCVNRIVWLHFA